MGQRIFLVLWEQVDGGVSGESHVRQGGIDFLEGESLYGQTHQTARRNEASEVMSVKSACHVVADVVFFIFWDVRFSTGAHS